MDIDATDITKTVGRESLGLLKGFRDFIARGNVVDLAVGIVVGAAFTAIVTRFTADFIQPLIKVFGGGDALRAGKWIVHGQAFNWSDFLNQVITFLIVAAVLYFLVVLPMNKVAERRRLHDKPEPVQVSDEVAVLMEIRDALLADRRTPPARRTAPEIAQTDGRSAEAPATR